MANHAKFPADILQEISDHIQSFIDEPSLALDADAFLTQLQDGNRITDKSRRWYSLIDNQPCVVTHGKSTKEYKVALKVEWQDAWTGDKGTVHVYDPYKIAARICLLAENKNTLDIKDPFR